MFATSWTAVSLLPLLGDPPEVDRPVAQRSTFEARHSRHRLKARGQVPELSSASFRAVFTLLVVIRGYEL